MAWRGFIMKKLTKTDFVRSSNTTWSRYRLNPYQQQVRCFRQEAKKPKTKKNVVEQETKVSLSSLEHKAPAAPIPRPSLIKPILFTLGFSGCSFAAAGVLQYENLRSKLQAVQDEDLGSHDMTYWHNWWNQQPELKKQFILLMSVVDEYWSSIPEQGKALAVLVALNTVVFLGWKFPSLHRNLIKYFSSNPASKTRCLPMGLAPFSHVYGTHFLTNMYVLWAFGPSLVSVLGQEQFTAFYLSAGVFSSLSSYMWKTATQRYHPSLGASGALMAILGAVFANTPEAQLGVIFFPMIVLTAGNVLGALVVFDAAAMALGWTFFDHAAHLGGALFGVWYITYGQKHIWKGREPLVKLWHSLRSKALGEPRPGAHPRDRGDR